jgi:cardiolipin-specific phospholipase/abhydrolase domain-containing protein 4
MHVHNTGRALATGLHRGTKTSRPEFPCTALHCTHTGRPAFPATDRASAEDFFLESLHAWRAQQGLDKFILVGHSLGGYLAALYALRHPEHVQHLVLVGPAGIVSGGMAGAVSHGNG